MAVYYILHAISITCFPLINAPTPKPCDSWNILLLFPHTNCNQNRALLKWERYNSLEDSPLNRLNLLCIIIHFTILDGLFHDIAHVII